MRFLVAQLLGRELLGFQYPGEGTQQRGCSARRQILGAMVVLPPEIIHQILSFYLFQPQQPITALLTTASLFLDISQNILYSNLHFTSRKQLVSFISTYSAPACQIPCAPRSVELDITEGDESKNIFAEILALFSKCLSKRKDLERDEFGRPLLDLLRLRLNSHYFDLQMSMICDALSLVK